MESPIRSKLMDYALRSLGRRALTIFEMRKKLRDRSKKLFEEVHEEEITQVLDRLLELRLLDDELYTQNFIKTKVALNPAGKRGLSVKLMRKGIGPELFNKTWEELKVKEPEVLESAYSAFVRKKGNVDSQKQKERLMRYLASRGFAPDLIYEKLREI